jgi:hypothetical protein
MYLPCPLAIRRHRPGQVDDSPEKRQPVPRVHVDQTPESARARVYRHVPDDADELVKKRYQIINLWRPINHPAHAWPLALCDYNTVDAKRDLVPMTLRYPDREGETFAVLFNPQQRWKYVSSLTPEEGVLIKWCVPRVCVPVICAYISPLASTQRMMGRQPSSLPTLHSRILRRRRMRQGENPSKCVLSSSTTSFNVVPVNVAVMSDMYILLYILQLSR